MPLELPDDSLSPEQIEFRDALRKFFEERSPMTETRAVLEADIGMSFDLWARICDELSLPGLAIPEAAGGEGFGLAELAVALGESGRALSPIPLFGVAGLTARVVSAVASENDRKRWLEPLARGIPASLAWVEASGDWSAASTQAEVDSAGRVGGEKWFLLDADVAERFFVVARSSAGSANDGLGLYAVEADAVGIGIDRLETLDPTRRLFKLTLEDVEACVVGTPGSAGPLITRGLEEATALLCAEMVGGMQRVLEAAVDHARTRHQFGRPIGSFQAIKHKAADMLIDFESARTATAAAIEALDAGDPEATSLVEVAKAHTGPAYERMATESIQIQGGVGYTWEYDAHLYFRRAQSSAILLGEASEIEERLARRLAAGLEQGRPS